MMEGQKTIHKVVKMTQQDKMITFKSAGGISTVSSGFVYSEVKNDSGFSVYFLCNSDGECFARFFNETKSMSLCKNSSGVEVEAANGFKMLFLKW